MAGRKEKIMVLIPTRDRPEYLHATVTSVVQQAERFNHHVEIIISDTSTETNEKTSEANSETNARLMKKISERVRENPKVKIHYYGPGTPEPIRKLIKEEATPKERESYQAHVPANGNYGAHRNRLELLTAYHAGKEPEKHAYLHLDDDTPLWVSDSEGKVKPNPKDALGAFLKSYRKAVAGGRRGASADIFGLSDGWVSGYKDIGQSKAA